MDDFEMNDMTAATEIDAAAGIEITTEEESAADMQPASEAEETAAVIDAAAESDPEDAASESDTEAVTTETVALSYGDTVALTPAEYVIVSRLDAILVCLMLLVGFCFGIFLVCRRK